MNETEIVTTEKIGEGVVKYLNDEIENLDKDDRINLTELYLHLPDSKVEDKLREMLESKGGKVSIIINLVPTEVIESLVEMPEINRESINKTPSDNIYWGPGGYPHEEPTSMMRHICPSTAIWEPEDVLE